MDDETTPQHWMPAISSRQLGALMGVLGALALGVGLWPQAATTAPAGEAAAELGVLAAGPGVEGALIETDELPTEESAAANASSEAAPITIYIVGAVQVPGVYALPATARVHDAVARAGGLSPEADSLRVNLAQPIADGEQIVVPYLGETTAALAQADTQTEGSPAMGGLLNLNTASASELEELPKIGETLAARIVEHREANGPFADIEALRAVKGVSSGMLSAIAPLVVVE